MKFTIPGEPVAKGRAKGNIGGHHYTPEKTRAYEDRVKMYARQAGVRAHAGAVGLTIDAYGGRGDWDNIGKAISDALNGLAYVDDRQVMDGRVRKHAADLEGSRVEVEIRAL